MDKGLHLQPCGLTDLPDLLQGKLPGRYHPDGPHPFKLRSTVFSCHGHLGADVEGQIRKMLPDIRKYTQVLDQDRIQSRLIIGL